MSQLPITSRIKRSPLLKGSPYKQTETPEASVVSPGEDQVIETDVMGEKTDYVHKGEMGMTEETRKGICDGSIKGDKSKVHCDDVVVGKKKETVEGEDILAPTYSKRTGDVQTNFEGRQLGRQTKFKNRYVRQSKNKLAKAKDKMANFKKKYSKPGKDADGNPTSVFTAPKPGEKGYKQYMRLDSKVTENENELADFKAGSSNQAEVMRSGKTIGKNYRMDEDRRDTAADQTKDERIAQVRAENAAANNIVTSGQAVNAVEVNNNTGSGDGAIETKADTTKYGEYETKPAPTNMRSAFKMKAKSPAAKKLQGNQGKLPQHLQDAIKSAPESPAKIDPMTIMMVANAVKSKSSNKMRSGFKMKGYGKK
jgi:hypothetical protein